LTGEEIAMTDSNRERMVQRIADILRAKAALIHDEVEAQFANVKTRADLDRITLDIAADARRRDGVEFLQ
jgi:hypothetical protein